ncbi:hypothetical protein L873DRAFT_1846686 [Choiromyces venosus 120613-1]|uniref:Uncharacterized protein n=1 Tax=Choiromyces venosus 120613-1 TaxID=1336337 RepID=A0A3N4J7X0_9PEZI|nr:hypothetical protein L873DRAFT_1846686 [Choiromyces venosus 120613-1]
MAAGNNEEPDFVVVAELRALRTDMAGQFEDLRLQLDEIRQEQQVAEFNSFARLQNSSLSRRSGSELIPLRTAQNQHVNGFPQTLGQLNGLNSASVNALLTAYDLTTERSVPERHRRLRMFIGVIISDF